MKQSSDKFVHYNNIYLIQNHIFIPFFINLSFIKLTTYSESLIALVN